MLQIYVYGPNGEQGFLELSENARLNTESLADAFDEDLSNISEFTLPSEAPWTPKNRRLFGFAERLENFQNRPRFYECIVYNDYVPEIPKGKLTILEKSGYYTYKKGKFNFTISGTKGLFGAQIRNKTLQNLTLGGVITWENDESRKFAEDVMKGLYPQYPYLRFAPVAIENFIQTNRPDHGGEFLARDCVNNLIVTGAGANDWTFNAPNPSNPSEPASSGNDARMNYRTIPFFTVKWVFRKMMEELGYTLIGEFMSSTDFDDLVIFNNYAIENYQTSARLDFNRSIFPTNHVPSISLGDFFKGVCKFFNFFPVFMSNNQVRLIYRTQYLKEKRILNLSALVSKSFVSSFDEQGNSTDSNGYKLALQWDSNDGYKNERVKDLKDVIVAGTVTTFSQLATFNPGYQLTTDHVVFVEAENLYYRVANATTTPILWNAYAEKLDEFIVGEGERTVDIPVSTLCTYVEFVAADALFVRRNYVGTRQPGSYRNNKGVRVTAPFELRFFYISRAMIGTNNIPISYNHNRLPNNTKIQEYSLSFHGPEGLARLHESWQRLRAKAEVLKTTIQVNEKVLEDLKNHNIWEINNVQYLPFRTQRSIPLSTDMEIRVIPL